MVDNKTKKKKLAEAFILHSKECSAQTKEAGELAWSHQANQWLPLQYAGKKCHELPEWLQPLRDAQKLKRGRKAKNEEEDDDELNKEKADGSDEVRDVEVFTTY
jgi:hypothetical protein